MLSFVTGDVNTFHTTGNTGAMNFRNMWTLMRERDYIVLGIKSCGDAHVRLAYSIVSVQTTIPCVSGLV